MVQQHAAQNWFHMHGWISKCSSMQPPAYNDRCLTKNFLPRTLFFCLCAHFYAHCKLHCYAQCFNYLFSYFKMHGTRFPPGSKHQNLLIQNVLVCMHQFGISWFDWSVNQLKALCCIGGLSTFSFGQLHWLIISYNVFDVNFFFKLAWYMHGTFTW